MSKISELSDGGALQSTDYLIAVRSGGNVKVQPNGTVTGTTGSFSGNVTFADNAKAVFGAGSDLQIYHNGSNSFVDDAGTGDLYIRSNRVFLGKYTGEVGLSVLADGAVNLNYDNAQKLATTATGIDVTGTVTADGLTVDGSGLIQSSTGGVLTLKSTDTAASTSSVLGQINFYNSDSSGSSPNNAVIIKATGQSGGGNGDLEFKVTNSGIEGSDALTSLRIDDAGDISFYEDTGTTPKFFWDASTESLGIGTTSPAQSIDTTGNILLRTNGSYVAMRNSSGVDAAVLSMTASDITNVGAVFTGSQLALRAGGSEAMRITSAGNVGIGTSSPAAQLDVNGNLVLSGSNPFIYLNGSAIDQKATIRNQNGTGASIDINSPTITFTNDATERMRIDSSGKIQIGNNIPMWSGQYGGALLLKGDNATSNRYAQLAIVDSTGAVVNQGMRITTAGNFLVGCTALPSATVEGFCASGTSSGNFTSSGSLTSAYNHWLFYNGNGIVGSISTNGSATTYATSSDYRLKDVDGPIQNSGAYIDALKPVQGSWKADGSRFIGLIAHEVQEVSETPIATGEKDGEEMQGMDYSAPELIANLIAEIQSLRARVAQLEGA